MDSDLVMTLEQVEAKSGRIGKNDRGDLARTFHVDFSSLKIGDDVTPRAALNYAMREGKSSAAADDAVYVAGTERPVLEAAELIRQSARVRRGPNAERLLIREILELPSDTTRERWNEAAEAIVADWAKRGYPAVAVVHLHGEELAHPHLHVLASARRIFEDERGRPTVDRTRTLWSTRTELREERHNVARLINEACEPLVELNGGRLKDTGIDRPALTRVPLAAWHRRGQKRRHPAKAAAAQTRARTHAAEVRLRPPKRPSRRAQAEKELVAERDRANDAEAALETLQAGGTEPLQLTEQTREMLEGVCRRADVQLDLDTRAGQDLAFALRHLEEGRVSAGDLANIRAAFDRAGGAEHAGETSAEPAIGAAETERSPTADVPPGDARPVVQPVAAGDTGDTIEAARGAAAGGNAEAGTESDGEARPHYVDPSPDVEISTLDDGRVVVTSPFDERFRLGARNLGGKWSRKDKRWTFDADREGQVRALHREVFGTDGTETPETAPTAVLPSMDAEPEAVVSPAGDVMSDEAAGTDVRDTRPESGGGGKRRSPARAAASQAQPEQDAASGPGPADGDPDSRTAIGPARIEESVHDGPGTGEAGETHHDGAQGAGRIGAETLGREGEGTHRARGAEQPRSGSQLQRDEAGLRPDEGGDRRPASEDELRVREDDGELGAPEDGAAGHKEHAPPPASAEAMAPQVVADRAAPGVVETEPETVAGGAAGDDDGSGGNSHRGDRGRGAGMAPALRDPARRLPVLDGDQADLLAVAVTPQEPEPALSVPEASAPPQPPLEEDEQVQPEEAHTGAGGDASDYDWLMGEAGSEHGQAEPPPGTTPLPEPDRAPETEQPTNARAEAGSDDPAPADNTGGNASHYGWLMGEAVSKHGQSVPTSGNAVTPEQPDKPGSEQAEPPDKLTPAENPYRDTPEAEVAAPVPETRPPAADREPAGESPPAEAGAPGPEPNPFLTTPERKLRAGYRADRNEMDMHKSVLSRPSAVNVHGAAREGLEAARKRQEARRAAAKLRGIELVRKGRSRKRTRKS